MFRLGLLVLVLTFSGCAAKTQEPTLNGSSMEEFKASFEIVKDSLDKNKQKEFGLALMIIGINILEFSDAVDKATTDAEFMEALHGKTGKEVLSMAEDLKAKGI